MHGPVEYPGRSHPSQAQADDSVIVFQCPKGKTVALSRDARPHPNPSPEEAGLKNENPFMPGLRIREDGVKQPRRIATQQEVDEILLRRIYMAKRFRRTGAADSTGNRGGDVDGEAMPPDADALDAAWAEAEARRRARPSGA